MGTRDFQLCASIAQLQKQISVSDQGVGREKEEEHWEQTIEQNRYSRGEICLSIEK